MIHKELIRLMRCFPGSYITQSEEFIAHQKANEYFLLNNIAEESELKYKVLEWLSRAASYTCPFNTYRKNEEFNNFMLSGINQFLGTNFTKVEMRYIYQELGNNVNRALTEQFVASGYNMETLMQEDETNE